MENNVVPVGRFRIIIADIEKNEILVNSEAVCIVGAFTKPKEASSGLCSVHGMVLSKYATDVAVKTAEGAKHAVRKMENGAKAVDRKGFLEKVRKIFRGRVK